MILFVGFSKFSLETYEFASNVVVTSSPGIVIILILEKHLHRCCLMDGFEYTSANEENKRW